MYKMEFVLAVTSFPPPHLAFIGQRRKIQISSLVCFSELFFFFLLCVCLLTFSCVLNDNERGIVGGNLRIHTLLSQHILVSAPQLWGMTPRPRNHMSVSS